MSENGYKGQHRPLADGMCEHRWANRLTRIVRCDYGLHGRIDRLREAIDDAVDEMNAVWTDFPDERLETAVTRLQTARTNDDIANGRDWVRFSGAEVSHE